jgi:hypothetical protein
MSWTDYAPDVFSARARIQERALREENQRKYEQKIAEQQVRNFDEKRDAVARQPKMLVGYHPNTNIMQIKSESSGGLLTCHYNPTQFIERYTAEWHHTEITGTGIAPIVFKFVKPREWEIKLLFNSLGEDSNTVRMPRDTVSDCINQLRSWFLPGGTGGGIGSRVGNVRPPVLYVYLINEKFRCCLTGLSLTYLAIDPNSGVPTRALADTVFTEFLESPIP